jgi:hypothetical protein
MKMKIALLALSVSCLALTACQTTGSTPPNLRDLGSNLLRPAGSATTAVPQSTLDEREAQLNNIVIPRVAGCEGGNFDPETVGERRQRVFGRSEAEPPSEAEMVALLSAVNTYTDASIPFSALLDQTLSNGEQLITSYPGLKNRMQAWVELLRTSGPRPDMNADVVIFSSQFPRAMADCYAPPEGSASGPDARRCGIFISSKMTEFFVVPQSRIDEIYRASESAEEAQRAVEAEKIEAGNRMLFVLAHEYAHILLDHPKLLKREQNRFNFSNLVQNAAALYTVYRAVEGTYNYNRAGRTLSAEKDAQDLLGDAVLTSMAANLVAGAVDSELQRTFFPPYSRQLEDQADFGGLYMMNAVMDSARQADRSAQISRLFAVDAEKSVGELFQPRAGVEGLGLYSCNNAEITARVRKQVDLATTTVKNAALAYGSLIALDEVQNLLAASNSQKTDFSQAAETVAILTIVGGGVQILQNRYDQDKYHLHRNASDRIAQTAQLTQEMLNRYQSGIPLDRDAFMDAFPNAAKGRFEPLTTELTGTYTDLQRERDRFSELRDIRERLSYLTAADVDELNRINEKLSAYGADDLEVAQLRYKVLSFLGDIEGAQGAIEVTVSVDRPQRSDLEALFSNSMLLGNYRRAEEALNRREALFPEPEIILDRIKIAVAERNQEKLDELLTTCRQVAVQEFGVSDFIGALNQSGTDLSSRCQAAGVIPAQEDQAATEDAGRNEPGSEV